MLSAIIRLSYSLDFHVWIESAYSLKCLYQLIVELVNRVLEMMKCNQCKILVPPCGHSHNHKIAPANKVSELSN